MTRRRLSRYDLFEQWYKRRTTNRRYFANYPVTADLKDALRAAWLEGFETGARRARRNRPLLLKLQLATANPP